MATGTRLLSSFLLSASLAASVISFGCAEHRYYSVNDPYYHDHHRWNPDEDAAYRRWEAETHREHREYREREAKEQQEYWNWRHSHGGDRDHDHDHDHDRH